MTLSKWNFKSRQIEASKIDKIMLLKEFQNAVGFRTDGLLQWLSITFPPQAKVRTIMFSINIGFMQCLFHFLFSLFRFSL